MLSCCLADGFVDVDKLLICCRQINLLFTHRGADVTGNIEVEVILLNLCHLDPTRVAGFLFSELVGVDDLGDVIVRQLVLTFTLYEVLGSVDEQNVVGFLTLLEDENAHGDTGGIKQVRRQADDGVDVAVLEQLGANAFFRSATEKDAVRQDDGHHSFVFEEVEAVKEKCEVGSGLGGEAVAFESYIVCYGVCGFPAVAERWIGDDCIELWLLCGVHLPHHVPLV